LGAATNFYQGTLSEVEPFFQLAEAALEFAYPVGNVRLYRWLLSGQLQGEGSTEQDRDDPSGQDDYHLNEFAHG
jgi:hypothetical protein